MLSVSTSLCVLLCTVCVGSTTIHVAVNGSDSGDGSSQAPFATIPRALTAARGNTSVSTIELNSGVYFVPLTSQGPISLTSEDTRAENVPLTITSAIAEESKQAIVSGGIPVTGWVQSTADPRMWLATLPEGTLYFRQLFANGVRQTLARSKTFSYAAADTHGFTATAEQLEGVPATFEDIHVVLFESWTVSLHQIAGINASYYVSLKTPYNNKWSGSAAGSRYYFENYLGGLDRAGEFYYNSSTRELWWYPPSYIPDPNQATVIAPQLINLISIIGGEAGRVSNIQLSNLRLEHTRAETESCFESSCDGQSASFLTSATVLIHNASHIQLSNINITNVGGYAVWFAEGVTNSSIQHSYLANLGAGGVRIGSPTHGVLPRAQQTTYISVVNNFMEAGSQFYLEGCGVLAQATAYTDISNNLITNFSYTGISLGWTWGYAATSNIGNTISRNSISFIGKGLLSDMGCIYTLGNNPQSNVTNNVCHDVFSYNYGGWGLYTDEGSRGLVFKDNIIYHTKCAGLHQHYGFDNLFINNVFASVNTFGCDGGVRSSPSSGPCDKADPKESCTSFDFMTNIVYVRDGALFYGTTKSAFSNTTFDRNTYWSIDKKTDVAFPNGTTFQQWQSEGEDTHSVVADPLFTNPTLNDYSHFQSASPALKLGFVPINVTGVGPSWVGRNKLREMPRDVLPFVTV